MCNKDSFHESFNRVNANFRFSASTAKSNGLNMNNNLGEANKHSSTFCLNAKLSSKPNDFCGVHLHPSITESSQSSLTDKKHEKSTRRSLYDGS